MELESMNPKKLIVPVLCVLLGCAGGAAMGSVTAQTWPQPANVQRWQQECVAYDYRGRNSAFVESMNALLRERGDAGWEYVEHVVGEGHVACFKRPAQ